MSVIEEVDHEKQETFIVCRNLRHAWDVIGPTFDPNAVVWDYKIQVRCMRCGTERQDAIDVYGNIVYRRYVYPEGYQYAADERPTTEDFRLMLLKERGEQREGAAA